MSPANEKAENCSIAAVIHLLCLEDWKLSLGMFVRIFVGETGMSVNERVCRYEIDRQSSTDTLLSPGASGLTSCSRNRYCCVVVEEQCGSVTPHKH